MQAPADEPRSRRPSRARTAPIDAATSDESSALPAQIGIDWSETATHALRDYARQRSLEALANRPHLIAGRTVLGAGAKRAHNLVARQTIKLALQQAKSPYPALDSHLESMILPAQFQVDLQWIDDAEMRSLNRDTRGKDKPTDVLSFPVWEGEAFPIPPDESAVMLGDLVISIETAMRQARELEHDLRVEIAFLAAHGTLHLLGYDHGTDKERRAMFALQDEIVAGLREARGF